MRLAFGYPTGYSLTLHGVRLGHINRREPVCRMIAMSVSRKYNMFNSSIRWRALLGTLGIYSPQARASVGSDGSA